MEDIVFVVLILGCFIVAFYYLLQIVKEEQKNKIIIEKIKLVPKEPIEVDINNGWISINEQKPPHEVVLACFESYDCGWFMETAWWDINDNCWRLTGNDSEIANLQFTHWRLMPNYKFPKSKYE